LLIDFNFSEKNIVVVGGGRESYKKILKFIKEQPEIKVFSRSFSAGLKRLCREGKVELVKFEVNNVDSFIKSLNPKPDLVIAATDNPALNAELAVKAKSSGCMAYAIDNPQVSDFTLPALAEIGDVKVAISTGGKSPAMARALRKKVEGLVREEDLLQIRLQLEAREILKKIFPDQRMRKRIIYEILHDRRIAEFLKMGCFNEALAEAINIIEGHKSRLIESSW
jgi:precorrin-2 dehydrogenase/sirohydrochlorin ferrochelatase